MADRVISDILRARDSIFFVDHDVFQYEHLRLLSHRTDLLKSNNCTILSATSRNMLSAVGFELSNDSVEISSHFSFTEKNNIDAHLNVIGFQKWNQDLKILDNIFNYADSEISKKYTNLPSRVTELADNLCFNSTATSSSSLEFCSIFYLSINQSLTSRIYRDIARAFKITYSIDVLIEAFAKKWGFFVDLSQIPRSRINESSTRELISNSPAWLQYSLRKIAANIGPERVAQLLYTMYKELKQTDQKSINFLIFDNLNSVFDSSQNKHAGKSPILQAASIIRIFYEKLSDILSTDPNYWLQRAKSIYYTSNDEAELRIAAEFTEKGIDETHRKTWVNAKLTRANIFGKICYVTKYKNVSDIDKALSAYIDAIDLKSENRQYVNEMLEKGRAGKGYIDGVCRHAQKHAIFLPNRHEINRLSDYIKTGI